MKITVDKNGKHAQIYVGLAYYSDVNCFYATAYDKQKKQLGYMSFTISENIPDTVWLYRLYVDENSRGKMVGTALLRCLEAFCLKNGKSTIMAKFVPENQRVENFYKENGFSFENDFLSVLLKKKVDAQKKDNVFCTIENYKVLGVNNAKLTYKKNGKNML